MVDCACFKHLLCCLYRREVFVDDRPVATIDLYIVVVSSYAVTLAVWRNKYEAVLIVEVVEYSLQCAGVSF